MFLGLSQATNGGDEGKGLEGMASFESSAVEVRYLR